MKSERCHRERRRAPLGLEKLEARQLLTSAPALLRDLHPTASSDASGFVLSGGMVFFTANDGATGTELWRTDGTGAGTVLVKDLRPDGGSTPTYLTDVNGALFFVANDGATGAELWKSDGTAAGTVLVKDIRPGAMGSAPGRLTNVNGTLYFRADDGVSGAELWKSDGTAEGTVLVQDLRAGGSANPRYLANIGGALYFTANDGSHGTELWKHDPAMQQTLMVKDINPGPASSYPGYFRALTNVNGTLYFAANTAASGFELWKSDGTEAGTSLVKDILPGSAGSWPLVMTNVNGTLYFTANDGQRGFELWHSDGTPGGTTWVKDINTAAGVGSGPDELINVNGALYFRANDGAHGTELWRSDGTDSGTVLVADLQTGGSSTPRYLTNVNGTLYFQAAANELGTELWKVSPPGSPELVLDIWPYSGSSSPASLANMNGTLFFSANTSDLGREPWMIRAATSQVQTARLFYNQSKFDGNNAAMNASDDNAIATDKVAYFPGSGPATFANISSYAKGINGIMLDVAGLTRPLTAADFSFRMGSNNAPSLWATAPAPTTISIRPGAGVGGSDRVELIWPNGALTQTWLEVTLRANFNTNLSSPFTFYFGSTIGNTGFGDPAGYSVTDIADENWIASNGGVNVPITHPGDITRDGLVTVSDQTAARGNYASLPLIHLGRPPATVLDRWIFYNQSKYDSNNAAINASDDFAIAIDKRAYLAGTGPATFSNITSYIQGINGVMVDIAGAHGAVTAADFSFKIGSNNSPQTWMTAPAPSAVEVRPGAGGQGADRVVITWPAGAIKNTWLQVTLAANARTGLSTADVFYFGNLIGDSGQGDSAILAITGPGDELAARNYPGFNLPITSECDYNRDGVINVTDQLIARLNGGFLTKINLTSAPAAPTAEPAVQTPQLLDPRTSLLAEEAAPLPAHTRRPIAGTLLTSRSDREQQELAFSLSSSSLPSRSTRSWRRAADAFFESLDAELDLLEAVLASHKPKP